jgi:hypothetical protein
MLIICEVKLSVPYVDNTQNEIYSNVLEHTQDDNLAYTDNTWYELECIKNENMQKMCLISGKT